MKRKGNLWGNVCDRKNIEVAAMLALKGKPLTKDRLRFVNNREAFLNDIEKSLINETYKFSELFSFIISEPKVREIHCPRFYPDRILHHAIMNIAVPLFIEKFTADTYGSIKGRGVKLAADKLKKALANNPNAYYLQVDVKSFYQSISHDVAINQISRVIKCNKTLNMFKAIFAVHEQGMPIGSYTSQYVGNLVLSPVDHWAKEQARIKHYFRYMDDIVILCADKHEAHTILQGITTQIETLKLSIKNNVRIAPVALGIEFIGYKFYPTHTRLRKRIKLKMQRNVRKLIKKNVSDKFFMRKTASHFGWCIHANCRNLLRSSFKEKIQLFKHKMEIRKLSEIKEAKNWFGLPKTQRVSIERLYNVEIIFLEVINIVVRGEPKIAVRFAYPNDKTKHFYFITRSDVIKDRLNNDSQYLPFLASIKKVKNYIAYE
jgi:RNA-directed DNA polymerase